MTIKPVGNQKIKVKSDNDLDGDGCTILAELAFGENVENQNHGRGGIDQAIEKFLNKPKNKNIFLFITDTSPNDKNVEKIEERYKQSKNVLLLDHHEKAEGLNKYEWAKVISVDEKNKKTSATSLFYEWLVENDFLKKTPALDEFVELVRSYDTWDWYKDNNTKAKELNDLFYIIGIKEFHEKMTKRLKNNPSEFAFTENERLILNIEKVKIEKFIDSKEKEVVERWVDDYKVGIVHTEQYHSELGNELGLRMPFLDIIVMIKMGNKKVSYRTIHDHINVNKFASKFGGGGHPKSSGSTLTEKAYELFVHEMFNKDPRTKDPEKNKFNVKSNQYGTFYENQSTRNDTYIITPEGKQWNVTINETSIGKYETYEKAEYELKRMGCYLSRDDVLIEYFSKKNEIKEATLRSQFEQTMKRVFNK